MNVQGTYIAINNMVSQSIDHFHAHIVLENKVDGLKGFFWPRSKYQNETQMLEVRLAIKKAIKLESEAL